MPVIVILNLTAHSLFIPIPYCVTNNIGQMNNDLDTRVPVPITWSNLVYNSFEFEQWARTYSSEKNYHRHLNFASNGKLAKFMFCLLFQCLLFII